MANFENAAYCTAADAPFAGVSSVTDAFPPTPNSQRRAAQQTERGNAFGHGRGNCSS
jgi:hypothetical protein